MKEKSTDHLRFILSILLVIIVILCGIGFSIFLNLQNKGVLGVITYNSSETFIGKEMQDKYDKKVLTTYAEYEEFIKENNLEEKLNSKDFNNKNFVIIILNLNGCSEKVNGIRKIKYDKDNVKIKIGYDASCGLCAPRYETYLIPIKKVNVNEVNYEYIKENNPNCATAIPADS